MLLSADFRVFFSSSFFHTTGLILHSVLSNSEIKYASHLIWRTICSNQNCDKAIPIYFKLGGSILLEKSAKNVTNLKYNISIFSRLQKYLPSQLKYLEIILLCFCIRFFYEDIVRLRVQFFILTVSRVTIVVPLKAFCCCCLVDDDGRRGVVVVGLEALWGRKSLAWMTKAAFCMWLHIVRVLTI